MNPILRLLLILSLPACLQAESLESSTAMRLNPTTDAPVILVLPAGAEITPLTEATRPPEMNPAPDGWWGILHLASYQGYVSIDDILKDFTVGTGATIYLDPSAEADLLAFVGAGEEAEVMSVTGDWARIVIRKTIGGYIPVGTDAGAPRIAETPTQETAPADVEPSSPAEPPAMPPHLTPAQDSAMPPRLFSGRLERTRRIFGRGPDQDFQLIDDQGRVLAYLEVQGLLTTEPVELFLGQKVNIFGIPRKPEGSKVIIVRVESLRFVPKR